MFQLSKSDYYSEFEIKVSRSDFKADAKKTDIGRWGTRADGTKGKLPDRNKHEELAARSIKGPVHFWFATPVGLFIPSEIPEWAGHIEFRENPRNARGLYRTVTKKAPRLHGTKASDAVQEQAKRTCYYRFHACRDALRATKLNLAKLQARMERQKPSRTSNAAKPTPVQVIEASRVFKGGLTAAEAVRRFEAKAG
jgi:hypothetical protein